jgi:hypothetical protein
VAASLEPGAIASAVTRATAFKRADHSDSGADCAVERKIDYHNNQKLDQLLPSNWKARSAKSAG